MPIADVSALDLATVIPYPSKPYHYTLLYDVFSFVNPCTHLSASYATLVLSETNGEPRPFGTYLPRAVGC